MDKTLAYQDLTVEVHRLSTLAWNLYQEGDIDDGVYDHCVHEADEMINKLIMRIESMLHTAAFKEEEIVTQGA